MHQRFVYTLQLLLYAFIRAHTYTHNSPTHCVHKMNIRNKILQTTADLRRYKEASVCAQLLTAQHHVGTTLLTKQILYSYPSATCYGVQGTLLQRF